jgi:universal stress protein E
MKQFKNILYAMNLLGDESEGLKQSLSLARNSGASLNILALYPELPTKLQAQSKSYETFLQEHTKKMLTKAQESVPSDMTSVRTEIRSTDIPLGIELAREVIRQEYDLIIKEAEPKESEGFKALDMTILRKAPAAVWLARPIAHSRKEIRVCVAINPLDEQKNARELAIRLLQTARAIADDCSGTLEIVSFWEYAFESYMSHNRWASIQDEEMVETLQGAKAEHYMELGKLLKASGIEGKQTIHHIRGEASKHLGKFTKEHQIDIIVMGTLSRTGIAGFFIGNTAENVFEELTCSLLALKPHGYVSPVTL